MLGDVKKLSLIPWLFPVWCSPKPPPEVPTNGEGGQPEAPKSARIAALIGTGSVGQAAMRAVNSGSTMAPSVLAWVQPVVQHGSETGIFPRVSRGFGL